MAGDRPVLVGLLMYVLIAAAPTLMVWAALRLLPPALRLLLERRAARRAPSRPSLESVVGNVRRLRREVQGGPLTQVRSAAALAAYDHTLLELCDLVGVDAPLAGTTGSDRAFARLLTEAELEQAGIALDPPARGTAAA